jgi:hypothetical protein
MLVYIMFQWICFSLNFNNASSTETSMGSFSLVEFRSVLINCIHIFIH